VKTFDESGEVSGEHRFLGMFTPSALHEDVLDIPVVEGMVRQVIHRAGFPMESHSGQALLEVIQSWPRAELFSTDSDSLYATATGAIALADRRRIRAFLRRDQYGRFYSCVVFVPRDRYSTRSRQAMQEVLREELAAAEVEFAVRLGETLFAQVHFTVHTDPDKQLEPDVLRIQERLNEAVRGWEDQLVEAVHADRVASGEWDGHRDEPAAQLGARFAAALPEAYKEDFDATSGLEDLRRVDALSGPEDVAMKFYAPVGAVAGSRRFKLFLLGEGVSLSKLLPMLQKMDVEVVDQRPYEVKRPDGSRGWIYDFGLYVDPDALAKFTDEAALLEMRDRFQEAFRAMWEGTAEIDGFNGLVLRGGLTWRQASVLRAYSRYLRQAGTPYSQEYVERTVLANSGIAAALVELFEAKFDPGEGDVRKKDHRKRVSARGEEIAGLIDAVVSLDEDRILRGLLALIKATLRTNYYRTDSTGEYRPYLSIKLEPKSVPDLPEPRPRFEIFVCSPRLEGVHLRFGAVARGGLRWSDRREDFRTEILGLVKAQAVK
ncbi:MAG: NAD-glutamate dehydrogenase domain-containing protein, partial [Thermocrispum sp.]